jgi:cobaltochelatase CobS
MRHGLWLIVDELDFAEPAILSVLNSVLEHNGKLTLKEKGHEIVEPHPNFRIMATANGVGCMSQYRGLYQGTNLMNEAFLDRWRVYHIDYLPPEEEVQVIMASVPRMSVKVASVVVRVGNMIREAFKKEEIACTFSLRRMLDWCELLIRHKNALRAAEPAIFAKVSHEDAEVIRGIITRTMVSQKTTTEAR